MNFAGCHRVSTHADRDNQPEWSYRREAPRDIFCDPWVASESPLRSVLADRLSKFRSTLQARRSGESAAPLTMADARIPTLTSRPSNPDS
jgi:hypothetical protein